MRGFLASQSRTAAVRATKWSRPSLELRGTRRRGSRSAGDPLTNIRAQRQRRCASLGGEEDATVAPSGVPLNESRTRFPLGDAKLQRNDAGLKDSQPPLRRRRARKARKACAPSGKGWRAPRSRSRRAKPWLWLFARAHVRDAPAPRSLAESPLEASLADGASSDQRRRRTALPGPPPSFCAPTGAIHAPLEAINSAPCPIDAWVGRAFAPGRALRGQSIPMAARGATALPSRLRQDRAYRR
jgi:hypothetical protein